MKANWKILSQSEGSLLERLLENRGLTGELAQAFLDPLAPEISLARKLFPVKGEIAAAGELVRKAVADGRPIFIHGDYDVDGIAATAILWQTIYRELGYGNCQPFIPNRFEHGYGLTRESIDDLVRSSMFEVQRKDTSNIKRHPSNFPALLITVDCGVTATAAVEYAQEKGWQVLVVDHHARPERLPTCSIFWSDQVCAAALAWIISQELKPDPLRFLDLVALATVADLQPLQGFNRSLAKFGLERLSSTDNLGLKSLMKVSGIEGRKIGTFEVGWIIAPRINASGRLEDALEALRLLCSRDEDQTREIAQKLEELNRERQAMTRNAFDLAREILKEPNKINVVVHEGFHEGIIGLVAGKLVAEFRTPAIVVSKGEQFSKASARSVEGFNIVEFLRSLGDHFEDLGGHAGAAGFTIETEKITALAAAVEASSARLYFPDPPVEVDGLLDFGEIDDGLLDSVRRLEPFGLGNREPVFLSRQVSLENVRTVGDGKHLKLGLSANDHFLEAIYFGQGALSNFLNRGDSLDVVYTLSEDHWNGDRRISLKIKDLDKLV